MRWKKAYIIAMKEFREVIQSKYILFSIIGLPFLFGILMPLTYFAPVLGDPEAFDSGDDLSFFADFTAIDNFNELSGAGQYIIMMVEFTNMLFLMLPLILPTVIAADTFSGERDRKTVEALVVAPVTDTEIYMGKALSSVLPSTLAMWVTAVFYVILVDYFTIKIIGIIYLPHLAFVGMALFLGPLLGIASTNVMIWVSTRTTSTRDAQQLGSLIVLPIILVIMGTLGLSLLINPMIVWIGVLLMIIIDFFLVRIGISILDRERWVSN